MDVSERLGQGYGVGRAWPNMVKSKNGLFAPKFGTATNSSMLITKMDLSGRLGQGYEVGTVCR